MHGFRRARHVVDHQILIDFLAQERNERRADLTQRHQHMIQRGERGVLVLHVALAPEAFAAAADVPVAQLVHEVLNRQGGLGHAVVPQVVIDALDERVQLGENPLVHQAELLVLEVMRGRVEVVDIRIHGEEGIHVLQGGKELVLPLANRLFGVAAGQPRRGGGVEIPAERVGTELVQLIKRADDVAQMLGHLAPLLVLHMAQHDAVFKRRTVKQQRRNGFEGVEPAARLVDGFGDEIRREVLLELLLMLKGIVPLRKGHRARIVPAVDNRLVAHHFAAALFAAELHGIDEGTVELKVCAGIFNRHFAQFRAGADDVHVAAGALPHRQGGTPVAFAGQTPVVDVLQPRSHAAFLDVFRHPVDGAVVAHEVVFQRCHADEPRRARIVQQGRIAAPEEGIIMRELRRAEQQPALLQIRQHQRVGLLDEHARPLRFRRHAALRINKVDERHVVFVADAVVVLAERRGNVDDARAVGHGDVVVADDEPRLLVQLADGEVEQRHILHAFERRAGHFRQHLKLLLREHRLHQRLRHDVHATVLRLKAAVGVGRVHAQRHVRRQRPRGGRPRKQVGVFLALDREAHIGGRFLDRLVALRDLVGGQRRAAARAVRDNLVSLIQQPLLPDFLQAPPFGLDVVILIGDIRMLHVHPVADLIAHDLPVMQVLPDGLLAFLDERLDAVLFNLRLAVQPQRLFDFQLNGQAVGIPACFAQDAVPLHRPVARNQVFNDARFDMADMRAAVGSRRAVEERQPLCAVAEMERTANDVLVFPQLGDFFLARREVQILGNLVVHTMHLILVVSAAAQTKKSAPA